MPKILRNEYALLLFEVLVRLETSLDYKTVAWAFLRPFEEEKFDNFDKRLKLQVFHFNRKWTVYQNWKNSKSYQKYPSTLSVTLKALKKVKTVDPETKGEDHQIDHFDVSHFGRSKIFKPPDQLVGSLNLHGKGTNLLKINPSGDLVAIANPTDDEGSRILICSLPDLKVVQQLEGHGDFIYDLQWKEETGGRRFPQTLLSCSGDQTVLLWTIEKDLSYTMKIIPHVTLVYCSKFWLHQGQELILTAGKDSIVRVWTPFRGSFKILQELSKGTGYITSLVVSKGSNVYFGNSEGRVVEIQWTKKKVFEVSRTIDEDNVPVSHLELHPRIEKIFIGNQRGGILCLDLESLVIIQRFQMDNQEVPRRFLTFQVSNCGMFLISVGGGSSVYCWNIMTGLRVEEAFSFLEPQSGLLSSVDMPRKGSFVLLGRYLTNKRAVLMVNSSDCQPLSNKRTAQESLEVLPVERESQVKATAVKNKLSEIIEKLDKVMILPQLCDDEKISLSKEMTSEKKRIEEWLDRNVAVEQEAIHEAEEAAESDPGTFVVQRRESVKSNGTFTVEDKEGEDSEGVNNGTYEIKGKKNKARDPDADDTSVSDSVFG